MRSDQLWNSSHCNDDIAFMLQFAPNYSLKINVASIAIKSIQRI